MKRIFTLLLALVMVLSLAAPALAAEDVFEVPETEEAAAPEAPVAPEEEEAPVEEAPAEAPDMPQAAAAEPEDTAAEPKTSTLTVLGETDKLWCVDVLSDTGAATDYVGEYNDIPLQDGDTVYLVMDYRYTIQWDEDWQPEDHFGIADDSMPGGIHEGELINEVRFGMSLEDGEYLDVTLSIVENPNPPKTIPVTWTAPEGAQAETNDIVLLDSFGVFTCDKGYVPLFTGVRALGSTDTEDGRFETYFTPKSDAESVHVDVKKATGALDLTDPEDKAVYVGLLDGDATGEAYRGLVGGTTLRVYVEAGYDVKANVEPNYESYRTYAGGNVHIYRYEVPETGDINIEVVKTELPVDAPASGTGWACDEDTGDYYYFVDGVQKFNYWAGSQRGLWYYIGLDGKLTTGFQYVENTNGTGWYLFQTDNKDGCIGRMLTGWQWTYTAAGTGWFNTAHGGKNGQCTYTTAWGAYNAATGMWADGVVH